VDIEISDMEALVQAAERDCGLVAVCTPQFDWWGRWLEDYHAADAAYRHGFDPKTYGACDFALVQADSPLGRAELEARKAGRRLTAEEAEAVRVKYYGKDWKTNTSKPYSIGVVKDKEGPGYKLAWDYMDARLVTAVGGNAAPRLKSRYGVRSVRRVAQEHRHQVVREQPLADGSVKLTVRVPRRG
jgi:hypothetical protein